MKKIKLSFFFVFFLVFHLWAKGGASNNQNNLELSVFNISFSQGIAYGMPSKWRPIDDESWIQISTPKIGTQFGVSISLRISEIRYLSLSYSNQYNGKKISEKYYYHHWKTWIHLNNYDFFQRRQFLSLTYVTKLNKNFEFGAGVSYMFSRRPLALVKASYDQTENIVRHNLWLYSRQSLRADDALALTAMLAVWLPINDYFELGIRTGGHLGVIGFESIYFTPSLRVKF